MADPVTEGLYWLSHGVLMYAAPRAQDNAPSHKGLPVDVADLDPLATARARDAQATLHALADPSAAGIRP